VEITITPSFVLQIISLVFTAGVVYTWVRFSIKSLTETLQAQTITIKTLEEKCKDIQHLHISRDDAYKAFVTKEIIDLRLTNLGESMEEIKSIVAQLHVRRSVD